jgi:Spy/CpxP family protein refolding chaperone
MLLFRRFIAKENSEMSVTHKVLGAALIFGMGATALAQQPQPNKSGPGAQQQERQQRRGKMERRGVRGGGEMRGLAMLGQLNLSDQQKQQAREIFQTNAQNTQAQRQELRQLTQQWRQGTLTAEGLERTKQLRTQLTENRKGLMTQLSTILTAEQKAKLDELQMRRGNHRRHPRRNRQVI